MSATSKGPRLADFDHKCLIGPLTLHLDDLLPTATFQGLPSVSQFLWGSFRGVEGNDYILLRSCVPNAAVTLGLFNNRGADAMHVSPEAASAYRGPIMYERGEQLLRQTSLDAKALGTPSFSYEQRLSGGSWEERGLVELEGAIREPSFQWYDSDPDCPIAYTTHMHRATGTILGEEVDGRFGHDWFFMKPGQWYRSSSLYERGVELTWMAIANEYADDTWEVGLIARGLGNWAFFIVTDQTGRVRSSTRVEARFEQKENGYPWIMEFDCLDEQSGQLEQWRWEARPNTEMVDIPADDPLQPHWCTSEGNLRRVGDERTLRRGMAWADFHADGRIAQWQERNG